MAINAESGASVLSLALIIAKWIDDHRRGRRRDASAIARETRTSDAIAALGVTLDEALYAIGIKGANGLRAQAARIEARLDDLEQGVDITNVIRVDWAAWRAMMTNELHHIRDMLKQLLRRPA